MDSLACFLACLVPVSLTVGAAEIVGNVMGAGSPPFGCVLTSNTVLKATAWACPMSGEEGADRSMLVA